LKAPIAFELAGELEIEYVTESAAKVFTRVAD
jgi:hypothetical protein